MGVLNSGVGEFIGSAPVLQLHGACPKFVVFKDRSGAGRPGGVPRQPPQPSFARRAAQGLYLNPERSRVQVSIKWTCLRAGLCSSRYLAWRSVSSILSTTSRVATTTVVYRHKPPVLWASRIA